jgi:Flp pilus assembly protein TadD
LPAFVSVLTCVLAGCAQDSALMAEGFVPDTLVSPNRPGAPDQVTREMETGALPETSKLVAEGKLQFSQGHYGLAIDAFSKSIERDSLNGQAWLGLAASYDQIGRFDQADKAYGKSQELMGATPSVLNNLGYSYVLRGNLDRARSTLAAAYAGDPNNPYIKNNIDILNERLVNLGKPPMVMNN